MPVYWGAWIGDQLTGTSPPWDMGAVWRFERLLGKRMSLVEFGAPFVQCGSGGCHRFGFPTAQMEAIREHGSIPLLSWGSEAIPAGRRRDPTLAGIARGDYDSYLREFAAEAAAWGHPFFLRFDWEMNGRWFPWGKGAHGNTPRRFVAAWRHVHDLFEAAGASDVTWVWCPYVEGKHKRSRLRSYYPGSRYVDWTCIDGYNWGENRVNPQPWKSFGQLFGTTYERLTRTVAPGKPIMLAELASNSRGGKKGQWIRQMFGELPRRFPAVRALVWFDNADRGVDWPLETSATATRAFSAGIGSSAYAGNRFADLSAGPVLPPR